MKVYVVMGNDFPEAVYASEADAEKFCEEKRAVKREHMQPKIYWRAYAFDLQEAAHALA